MARIKELLEKKQAGDISDAELKELQELQAEAKEVNEAKTEQENDDEEKAIDDMAQKLADQATDRLTKGLEKVLAGMQPKAKQVQTAETESKYIVDKTYGKKTIDELSEIKVALPNRKGKEVTEVSLKTAHFVQAWLTGDIQKLQTLVEGTGSRGGYLVPEEFANMIVEDIRDLTVMRQIADAFPVSTDTYHLPTLAARPQVQWRSEAATKATTTVDFGEIVLTPYSLAGIVSLSNELVADASLGVNGNIVNMVAQLISRAIAEKEDKAFWTGSGSTQPTGISQYTLGSVAAGLTDASRADAIKQTWVRLPQGYRNRAVWVMNSQTLEKVITLKDDQGNYLTSRLGDSPQLTLMGRPIYEQNDIAVGTAYFGDFSYYKIADREGISVRVSEDATVAGVSGFESNITHVRVEKRVDGELALTQAVRVVTGLGTP